MAVIDVNLGAKVNCAIGSTSTLVPPCQREANFEVVLSIGGMPMKMDMCLEHKEELGFMLYGTSFVTPIPDPIPESRFAALRRLFRR